MSTTDNAALLHSKILPFLLKQVYGFEPSSPGWDTITQMIEDGCLAAETIYECYEAQLCNGSKESGEGYDIYYIDQTGKKVKIEIKLRSLTTKQRKWGLEHSAGLTGKNTRNKVGDIVMGVYNPHRNTLDRFYLPIGEGYIPGKTVTITWSVSNEDYNGMEQYLISSTPLN